MLFGKRIPVFFFTLFWAGNLFALTVEPPKNPNSAKGCAICHYRWIDTFFVEGRGTDLVPYQSEKVAATPEMCFSCHDGSVRDSRDRMLHGKAHKTDVKPPAGMSIPSLFPLDDQGKVQCATCHTAHGVESGPGVDETIFLRTSNKNSAMCIMCHPDKDGGLGMGNHSPGLGKKPIPEALKLLGAHEGKKKNQITCETCHTAHGAQVEGYLVKGAGDCGLCLECHQDMNMFDRSGVRNANHAINVKPQTAVITDTLKKNGAKLGNGNVITCQTCHKIHNNPTRKSPLLIRDNQKAMVCLTCHPDKQGLEKSKHNLAVTAKEEKNLEGETPGQSGMCSSCHLPHKAARKLYEKKNMDRTTAQCLSCHAQGRIAANKKLSGYLHPVNVSLPDATQGTITELPLFNTLGVRDKKGKITCATCHDTHGISLSASTPSSASGNKSMNQPLLRKTAPELCRPCHREKFAVQNTRHDLGGVFPNGHPLFTDKVSSLDLCRNCHRIHSSEPEGLIWSKKTATKTGNKVEDSCTGCHDKEGLAAGKTIGENSHPVNQTLKGNMLASTLPLFDASGKQAKNGLMTCYTCHDPHRSTPIRSKNGQDIMIQGQAANRFLRMDIIPESKLCISCHQNQSNVTQSVHNLMITAPDFTNSAGHTTYESGVCGTCHLVHTSGKGSDLWAVGLGKGDSLMDRVCNSCHSEKGSASDKVPRISSHPETLFNNRIGVEVGESTKFPLYNKKTGKPVEWGNISCPSCHDPHQWTRPPQINRSPKKDLEGNATSSFLRKNIPDRVCKSCHGFDSLYMYKYFHNTHSREKTQEEKRKVSFDVPKGS